MLYCCEVCEKKHTSEEQALECERVHREEKARQEELAKEKEVRIKELNELTETLKVKVEKFRDDYGKYPKLKHLTYNAINPHDLWWYFM